MDAKYINPGTDFNAMYDFTSGILSQASAYAGVSAELYKKSNTYASGYAMQLARIDVIDKNISQISQYKNNLNTLLTIIQDTINIYTNLNIKSKNNVNIQIPETYTNRMQQLEIIQKQIALGIKKIEQVQ